MADFINNSNDSEFLAAVQQFLEALSGAADEYGASANDLTDLEADFNDYKNKLESKISLSAQAKSASKAKKASRKRLEKSVRERANKARAQSSINGSALALLGQIMSSGYTPLSNPTRPTGKVDTSQRLRHTISFADEAAPDIKRKPAGTIGCQIYMKTDGAPPTDAKECVFAALDTATPYILEFNGADAGKMIHYMLRWQLKNGTYSAWSETISATVTG